VDPRPGEWHGISLGHDGLGAVPRTCGNACRFCFVDQVPAGLRSALSVKDDDYRLSFLHGNFITLTNLDEADLTRIEELRLAPLYVSLHAWDDEARVRLMGRAAADSRHALERLARAGIDLHLQVVLCPGWNDGLVLAETVAMAGALPAVADLGIVPVSLAEEGDLRRVTPDDARVVLEAVAGWQSGFRLSRGHDFVHAADELHLLCGALPPRSDAPDQYENGIGISAELLAEVETLVNGRRPAGPRAAGVRLLSGTLAEPVISRAAEALRGYYGRPVRPLEVSNRLFGPHVTVTGLLGGAEVLEALRRDPLADGEWLLAPRLFLPAALGRTLDDVGEDELAAACDGRLAVVESLTEGFGRLSG
jgi:putative radical SAM enzyme (TIGR03279 family)